MRVVSFELILFSVEQSLRLLLLLHYSIVRNDTNHNPHVLYKAIKNKSGGKEGIRRDIISRINVVGQSRRIDYISEKDLEACLQKHDSSYSDFRYFLLDNQAKSYKISEFLPRELQILHCLAVALMQLNLDEMNRRGFGTLTFLRQVPESEMTEELKAVRDRLKSQ